MSAVVVALIVVAVAGGALAAYAIAAPRRRAAAVRTPGVPAPAPLHAGDAWTEAAGEEFAEMPEAARCDMVFAVAALDDERSHSLLEHALADPSEAVSLAAAHALAGSGRTDVVERYLAGHPGERADRIARTLALLHSPSP